MAASPIDLNEAFEPRALLELTDSKLAELVRFSGRLTYLRPVSNHDVALHTAGIAKRVEGRWRETRVRIYREPPIQAAVPPSLRMIIMCGFRLGPRTVPELSASVCWRYGSSWMEEIRNAYDVSVLRDMLSRWPEHAHALA